MREAEVGGVQRHRRPGGHDGRRPRHSLIAVYCTADDLLPERPGNARRRVTDAEVVTLCVAQAIMGIPSDRRFLAVARKRLCHLFPELPQQPGYHKRRAPAGRHDRVADRHVRGQSPGFYDDLLLIDSTPVECARSLETVRRSQLADGADYGYSRSHSRFFWGMRLHLAAPRTAPQGRWRWSRRPTEREVALKLLAADAQRRRGADRRQGLRRPRVRRRGQRAGRDRDAPPPQGRTRQRACTSPRSANGSSRSSGPAKTSSPSNATAPAPSPTSTPESPAASSPSPPASPSTTNSDDRAAHSSTTSPERVESII